MVAGTKLNDVLTGDAGDNRLDGLDGDDRLSGLGGDDLLIGGAGADILDGGDGFDLASYYTSAAGVTVNLAGHTAAGGEAQGDTLTGIEDLEGSDWNDTLTGDGGENWLYGLDGNDRLSGGGGDDLLNGGAGADILDGGGGVNAVSYAGSTAGVYVNLTSGKGAYGGADGDTLIRISDLIGSDFADTMRGDAGDNWMAGGAGADTLVGDGGNDTLRGGAGADTLDGGAGYNAASYVGSSAGVAVNLATGAAEGGDAQGDRLYQISDLIGSDFDDLLGGDAEDNSLYGNGGADKLWGNGGDDFLDGGAGADTLYGGAGYNAASYKWSSAGVAVNLATGAAEGGDAQGDRLYQISELIGSDFNDLLGGDAGGNSLYGEDGADRLWGNGGDDLLNGGAGADWLYGGAGNNAASYAWSSAGVAVNLATGAAEGGDAQGDRLDQISDLIGSDFNDLLGGDAGGNALYGDAGADKLWGNGGDDLLNGGAGADSLYGGDGNNAASYTWSLAGVSVNLATGAAAGGDAQGDQLYQISDLIGSDFNDLLGGDAGSNALYGEGGVDKLWGNGGDDFLNGGAGADWLYGGAGNNMASYAGSSVGVTVDLTTGAAAGGDAQGDRLYQISDLFGSDFNDLLVGDAGSNALYGSGGADRLRGNGGDDILNGGAGADSLSGGAGYNAASYAGSSAGVSVDLATGAAAGGDAQGDRLNQISDLFGSDFTDLLGGDAGSNALYGAGSADTLWGNGGDDFLDGGAGADSLYGGAGRDLFLFEAAADSGATAGTRDRIMDFTRGSDRIDLSEVDANANAGGNQTFSFIGGDAFTGVAGQLRVFAEGGALIVAGDLNGDRMADFTVAVSGATSLTAGDFVL